MALKTALGLRTQVRLALTPQMRQSLAVLRMPAGEVEEMIAREVADNPFLRLRAPLRHEGPAPYDIALSTVAARTGRVEALIHQIRQMPIAPDVGAVAEYLAGTLRDDGYLDGDMADFAAETGLDPALLDRGLAALQSCEPAGVGARSLGECIALQLRDRGLTADLAARAVAAIADLAAGRTGPAARRMAVTPAEAERIAGLLRGIDPQPLKPEADPAPVLRPDLRLRLSDDGIGVELTRDLPELHLDAGLAAAGFGAERRARAEALIAALRQRGASLLAIGGAVARHQEAFFRHGPDGLRPLTRAALAAELGLHPATVGRAVAGKGLEAGGRVFPLSLFFSPAVETEGESLSAFVLGRRIARMIAAEPAEAPLSDAAIAARMAEEGVDIARRTVAKYREGMKIPSSWRRRRVGVRKGAGGH